MQGKHLYEYAILRIVPRVEREEFVNVGVLICCKRKDFLACKVNPDLTKVLALDSAADLEVLKGYLESLAGICKGTNTSSPIAQHDAPARFRWLTANRSSMIQTSRPHGGFTEDLEQTLEELYMGFVE
ncbi:DUF3037 domain-containing protein [Mongoliitalea daihaiensis]|uniref:DUF3037 domain-containing protein n=1 Tax=Mongoliitalea daihaiensis TaxID=2782006 RepID=UPI001F34B364|nr:DUF3037 domain-containing protein [Mongoliitalea daihaiensis]UJP65301.1 DUF3037 domain-containing protein [Mongoliitalea daihaiensis]